MRAQSIRQLDYAVRELADLGLGQLGAQLVQLLRVEQGL